MATKKQRSAQTWFAKQARAKSKTKVGKAAASRARRKRKGCASVAKSRAADPAMCTARRAALCGSVVSGRTASTTACQPV